jgi:hypothetical protein
MRLTEPEAAAGSVAYPAVSAATQGFEKRLKSIETSANGSRPCKQSLTSEQGLSEGENGRMAGIPAV